MVGDQDIRMRTFPQQKISLEMTTTNFSISFYLSCCIIGQEFAHPSFACGCHPDIFEGAGYHGIPPCHSNMYSSIHKYDATVLIL